MPAVEPTLADLIVNVADQLQQAADASADADHVMQFLECELEMAVQVEKHGEAGIRVKVLSLGGGMKKSDSNTVRVKFTSMPDGELAFAYLEEIVERRKRRERGAKGPKPPE